VLKYRSFICHAVRAAQSSVALAAPLAISSSMPESSSAPSAAAKARARKACGVCADDMDLFAQMRSAINAEASKPQPSIPTAVAIATPAATTAATAPRPAPLPCPPDSASLGRATWTFLHTMSAYYPDRPTPAQQTRMGSFLSDFAAFYPCPPCAEHLQQHLVKHPPPTHTRSALSMFLCRYHNDVNTRLGKPQFDCARYDERWKDGPPEDAGYDCIEETTPNSD
jgi:FAD-linked sulfhydryl oxidase